MFQRQEIASFIDVSILVYILHLYKHIYQKHFKIIGFIVINILHTILFICV